MWQILEGIITNASNTNEAWALLLSNQLEYASTHGRSGGPMKASSTLSLLTGTIGTVGKYAPQIGKPTLAWRAKMQQLRLISLRKEVNRAKPLTPVDVTALVAELMKLPDKRPAIWFQLAWACAARGTSITKIQTRNVFFKVWRASQGFRQLEDSVAITFCEGKTISTTGAYTIHAVVSDECRTLLMELVARRRQYTYLFSPSIQPVAARILKTHGFEICSIRRGALQQMARHGVQSETLLSFSRHRDRSGLTAYLESGRFAHWEATQQVEAAKFLHAARSDDPQTTA
jgi:hypothetical protein